jgi:hypothetical protein
VDRIGVGSDRDKSRDRAKGMTGASIVVLTVIPVVEKAVQRGNNSRSKYRQLHRK